MCPVRPAAIHADCPACGRFSACEPPRLNTHRQIVWIDVASVSSAGALLRGSLAQRFAAGTGAFLKSTLPSSLRSFPAPL
jgi:hypothetical protein